MRDARAGARPPRRTRARDRRRRRRHGLRDRGDPRARSARRAVTMVDQSTHQLAARGTSPRSTPSSKIIGDAEELPFADRLAAIATSRRARRVLARPAARDRRGLSRRAPRRRGAAGRPARRTPPARPSAVGRLDALPGRGRVPRLDGARRLQRRRRVHVAPDWWDARWEPTRWRSPGRKPVRALAARARAPAPEAPPQPGPPCVSRASPAARWPAPRSSRSRPGSRCCGASTAASQGIERPWTARTRTGRRAGVSDTHRSGVSDRAEVRPTSGHLPRSSGAGQPARHTVTCRRKNGGRLGGGGTPGVGGPGCRLIVRRVALALTAFDCHSRCDTLVLVHGCTSSAHTPPPMRGAALSPRPVAPISRAGGSRQGQPRPSAHAPLGTCRRLPGISPTEAAF